jgi:hypothetical protein
MLNPHDTPGKQQVAYYALSKKVSTKAHQTGISPPRFAPVENLPDDLL